MPDNVSEKRWWEINITIEATKEDRESLYQAIEDLMCPEDHEDDESCTGGFGNDWIITSGPVDLDAS